MIAVALVAGAACPAVNRAAREQQYALCRRLLGGRRLHLPLVDVLGRRRLLDDRRRVGDGQGASATCSARHDSALQLHAVLLQAVLQLGDAKALHQPRGIPVEPPQAVEALSHSLGVQAPGMRGGVVCEGRPVVVRVVRARVCACRRQGKAVAYRRESRQSRCAPRWLSGRSPSRGRCTGRCTRARP